MNIWFTSDTHYHHKNIVRGVTAWAEDPTKGNASVQQTRDFKTLEEHDEALVKNINACVKQDDILYHLGDWSFGGIDEIWKFRKRLNCNNIHLVLGNHDHHIEKNAQIKVPKEDYYRLADILGVPFSERSGYINGPNNEANLFANTRELFSSVNPILHKKIGGQSMVLCHYSMRTWDKGHHGTWMLYGHSHGTLPEYSKSEFIEDGDASYWKTAAFKTMDVGIDTHPEFRPYHIDEIRKIMNKREPLQIDHHSKDTN